MNYQKEKLRKQSHLQSYERKNLGINLTKEVKKKKQPVLKHYKTLMKENENKTN